MNALQNGESKQGTGFCTGKGDLNDLGTQPACVHSITYPVVYRSVGWRRLGEISCSEGHGLKTLSPTWKQVNTAGRYFH
jgi:hypothetical protein